MGKRLRSAADALRRRDAASTTLLVLRESARSFGANRGLHVAATLAYYGFLSLMPLLLLALFLLGTLMRSSEDALAAVEGMTGELFPAFNRDLLRELLDLSRRRVWGVVSVVALLWSMAPFAGALRAAVYRIFKSDRRLHFVKAKLLDLGAVLALLLLFVGLAAGELLADRVSLPESLGFPHAYAALRYFLPHVFTIALLSLVYRVFAPVRPRLGPLMAGSVTTAALLFLIRPLFAFVLEINPDFGYAFGSLKAIFLVIVWVFATFAVVLFGAEVMANTQRREALLLRRLFLDPGRARRPSRLMERFVVARPRDDVLFHEGDPGQEMFYVLEGAVALTKNGLLLRTMGPGDYFGEMSMLIGAPRTATATIAGEGTRLVTISEDNFDTILRENPGIVRSILKEMALRLRATSDQLRS